MKIFITVKSLAKRKRYIDRVIFEFATKPCTLKELITAIVTKNVTGFRVGDASDQFFGFLPASEIEMQASSGKVGFTHKYNSKKEDLQQSIVTAITAFEDGLYKVFIGEEEIEQLDSPILMQDEDVVTFIRVTMLAGRIW
ncbi:hypothetical protein [Bacillus sp. V5-8f]|uniref:hypothetical protein n=1 Tax=Bacillus sp. V5-8f TaxID=2053044 RepID=UPI000C769A05|nr:hypothetical protein [Bacillus sp. V5-8f]PLT33262.1 hypothetical protein CUU64_14545 [Bacillus sp. V5-8f]